MIEHHAGCGVSSWIGPLVEPAASATVSLSEIVEPDEPTRGVQRRPRQSQFAPQARGARAVRRPRASLRRAVGGAQLLAGPSLAPGAGRRARAARRRAGAGRGDGHGHGRGRAARARRLLDRRRRPERRRCWPRRARASPPRRDRRVELRAGGGRAAAVRATRASTRSRFTYLLRYVDDPPATMRELARVVRPGGTDRLARVRRAARSRRRGPRGGSTPPSACRCSDAPRLARVGARWAASWARASAASTSAIRWSGSSATGARPGLEHVAVRQDELRRRAS